MFFAPFHFHNAHLCDPPSLRIVVNPELRQNEVEAGKQCNNRQQDPGQRRRITHLIGSECLFVKHHRVQISGVRGTAVRNQERGVELLERADHTVDQVKEHNRRKLRHGDVDEAADRARAVHLGRLVKAGGDLLQARQEDDHTGTELPYVEQNQGRQRPGSAGQPRNRFKAERLEDGVDIAFQAKDVAPYNGDRDGAAQQRRQVNHRAVQAHAAHRLVEHHRDKQRKDQLQRHGEHNELKGRQQRLFEGKVDGEDVLEVLEANPVGLLEQRIVGKGQIDGIHHRPRLQQQESDQPGGNVKVSLPVVLEILPAQHSLSLFFSQRRLTHVAAPPVLLSADPSRGRFS